jgi:cytochrome c biogenesis protein CcmG/thiol:disulfide interchange protein DsbE
VSGERRVAPIAALVAALVAVAFLVVLVVASPDSQTDAQSPLLGNPAPSVVTTTIDDESFDLARRKGSWVVLNFFNSTCVPCRAEHPELLAFADAQASSDQPAELYTVVNDDSDSAVSAYFDEHGGTWPKLRDDNGSIAVAFGVARVPETWIIDPNGFVRLRIAGKLTEGLLDEQLSLLQGES